MTSDLLKDLNKEQRQAVMHGDGPLLIVAGAGTGKTTVITRRLAWLIAEKKAKPDEILAVTFTDKAASEMEERVDRLLPLGYYDLWISTFHSFCQRVLRDHALDIGLPGDFKLLDQTGQWMLVRQNLDKFELDYYRPLGNPTKFIHALLKHFSRAKDEVVSPDEYMTYVEGLKLNLDVAESTGGKGKVRRSRSELRNPDFETNPKSEIQNSKPEPGSSEISRLEEVANAYHVYQQLLLESNALDFGDLINYTLKLFKARPQILGRYRQQFKHILVDEFQDTNWAQYELVKTLATPKNNLTVVADDDQSIYKFRGASVSNVTQFKHDFSKAEMVSITTNYRSRQEILDLSYKFIQNNNPNRLETQKLGGQTIIKKLQAAKKGKAEIEYLLYTDAHQEAQGVVQKIMEIMKTQNLTFNDFVILVRANNHADIFIQTLEAARLPYIFVASRGLYNKRIILDIISFLKLLDDYHESDAMWRVLNWPVFDISYDTLVSLNYLARRKSISLFEATQHPSELTRVSDKDLAEIKSVLKLIGSFTKQATTVKPRELILQLLKESKYLDYLTKNATQEHEQLRYLEQFDKRIKDFESGQVSASVKTLLAELKLEMEAGDTGALAPDLEAGPEAVRVMTIHASKGLEFEYVFIVNLVDKRLPSVERKEQIELPVDLIKETLPEGDIHLEEERRLMYVAMTRAKSGLSLTAAQNYGGKLKKKPSKFLYELNFVKSQAKSAVKVPQPKPGTAQPNMRSRYLLPSRFSYTQLRSFAQCPYQYYLDFVLRLPKPGNYHFSFGRTIHETLRRFFMLVRERTTAAQGELFSKSRGQDKAIKSGTKLPSLDELLKIYETQWIDDWYDSAAHKKEFKDKGWQTLKKYYQIVKVQPPQVELLEKSFNFKLKDKNNHLYTIIGIIDRVDRLTDGKVEIIDYKTGMFREKYVDKEQLLIYQIAAEEVFREKVEKLTFWFIDQNKPYSFLGSVGDIAKIKKKMLNIITEIKKADFTELIKEHSCRYCEKRTV